MEPNNIENQIKEKLKTREIQPSAQTWDRLDAMLTVAEEKKTKRFPFWFIGIAASVLVLLTVGLFFFNQEKNITIPTNEIVVAPVVKKTTINNEQPIVEQNQVATIENNSAINNQQSTINNPRVSISNQKNNQNPIINREKQIEFLINGDVALKDLPKIMTGDAIIVQPKQQITAKKPTYIDVDALLASVENSNKLKNNKIKVDANTLLSQAETEVETTFREKVINKINKNYQEVKSALANRNLE